MGVSFRTGLVLAVVGMATMVGIAACTAKVTTIREYDVNGKTVKETKTQTWKLGDGITVNPGDFIPEVDLKIKSPSLKPGTVPGKLPDGTPAIKFPGDPKVYPVTPVDDDQPTGRIRTTAYQVDVNVNVGTAGGGQGAIAVMTPQTSGAPLLMGTHDSPWRGINYAANGATESVASANPYLVASFLYSRGFESFGGFGSAETAFVYDRNGRQIANFAIGVTSRALGSQVFPLINTERSTR
jgi:hypothetical protein